MCPLRFCCLPYGCCCRSYPCHFRPSSARSGQRLPQRSTNLRCLVTSALIRGVHLRCLVAYLTLLAFVTLTAVNTQDRHRAETILFVLCIVTAVAAIENLIGKYLFLPGKAAAASYAAIGIVGVPLNIGALFLLVERHLTRGERGGSPSGSLSLKLSIGVAGAVLCAAALFNDPSPDAVMACGSGVAVLLLIILIRRFAIRAWSLGLLLGIVACLAVGAGVLRVQRDHSETMMALSTSRRRPNPSSSELRRISNGLAAALELLLLWRRYTATMV